MFGLSGVCASLTRHSCHGGTTSVTVLSHLVNNSRLGLLAGSSSHNYFTTTIAPQRGQGQESILAPKICAGNESPRGSSQVMLFSRAFATSNQIVLSSVTVLSKPGHSLLSKPGHIHQQSIRGSHNKIGDLRVDYKWKRERPIGPHKHKPPNLIDPRISHTIDYRKIVHYPKDGKYTIKKLDMTKLGGRHPVTGRKVIEGVGGGSKRKYRWIDIFRLPQDWPRDGSVLEEKILSIHYDPNRDAQIALTGYGDNLRWQIATDKMKQGDIIRTYSDIPKNPIRPREGDSHPLGALPKGTFVCQIEKWPGEGAWFMKKAEESAQILRKVGDRIIIKCWDRLEFSVPQEAQCVVGRNSIHPLRALPIGSPNRMRWLGGRPRSGLWQRKTGRHGRKIKKPPPTIETKPHEEFMEGVGTPSNRGIKGRTLLCDALTEGTKGRIRFGKRKITSKW